MGLTFADFKAGEPAQAMFRKLRLEGHLEAAVSWQSLRTLIVDYNDPDKGLFVEAARKCDGVASSGERVLLHAILYATDFAWLADELTEGRAWVRMDRVSGEWREAVAACILQRGTSMSEQTNIEWTDATWNVITGCSVVSSGCTHCYAMRLAGTRLRRHPSRRGLTQDTKAGPVWTGEVRLNETWLDLPLKWQRPRRIFVCAHSDLFHPAVPDEWIVQIFGRMAVTPRHTYQILTKRSARMREFISAETSEIWPLPNVWLGVSCEDQARADARIPDLLATPAAARFVSCEPLLGPIDLYRWMLGYGGDAIAHCENCGHGHGFTRTAGRNGAACTEFRRKLGWGGLDWVITGGESGPRPSHSRWFRAIRDQCQAARVAYFHKQNGEHRWDEDGVPFRVGKRAAGRLLDGRTWDEVPEIGRRSQREAGSGPVAFDTPDTP